MHSRTINCYFIAYSERSKGYKFYDPTTKLIFKTGNVRFFEDVEFAGGDKDKDFVFKEEYIDIPTGVISIGQDSISDHVENTTNQDNVEAPLISRNYSRKTTSSSSRI